MGAGRIAEPPTTAGAGSARDAVRALLAEARTGAGPALVFLKGLTQREAADARRAALWPNGARFARPETNTAPAASQRPFASRGWW